LWGVRQTGNDNNDPIRSDIYYSPDEGDTWVHADVFEKPASSRIFQHRIVCHPLNANIVAVIGMWAEGSDRGLVRVTNDALNGASASWVTNDAGAPGANNFSHNAGSALVGFQSVMMSSGRIVVSNNEAGFGGNPTDLWTTDSQGTVWVKRQTITNTDHHAFIAGAFGNKIVVARFQGNSPEHVEVYVSLDQGLSYNLVSTLVPAAGGFTGNNNNAIYHGPTDTLIVTGNQGGSGAKRVMALTPVAAGGVWADITFDLPSGTPNWDGLAVVP